MPALPAAGQKSSTLTLNITTIDESYCKEFGRTMVSFRTLGERTFRHHFSMAEFPFDYHSLRVTVRSRANEDKANTHQPVRFLPNERFPSEHPTSFALSASELWKFPSIFDRGMEARLVCFGAAVVSAASSGVGLCGHCRAWLTLPRAPRALRRQAEAERYRKQRGGAAGAPNGCLGGWGTCCCSSRRRDAALHAAAPARQREESTAAVIWDYSSYEKEVWRIYDSDKMLDRNVRGACDAEPPAQVHDRAGAALTFRPMLSSQAPCHLR